MALSAPTRADPYVLVGGQNGTWFEQGQAPRLYQISLNNYSVTHLAPVPSQGTVWSGGWNGSQWLISGWGTDYGTSGSNPYIYLYDGQNQVLGGSLNQYPSESSWHGGDVFAASYNGTHWLLSGLGSDTLSAYSEPGNHMALAAFDGDNFTDLSREVPEQQDAILYANAWNGKYWLVGGGFEDVGILFAISGSSVTDLTSEMFGAVQTFGSVQTIAWNGNYWLIGGVGFLAKFDGQNFTDLTSQLNFAVNQGSFENCCVTVNSVSWSGSAWMLAGGSPVALTGVGPAWAAIYNSSGFDKLTSILPLYSPTTRSVTPDSSILSVTFIDGFWILGGYSNGRGILYSYNKGTFKDLSDLVNGMSYVIWVGAISSQHESFPIRYSPHPWYLISKNLILTPAMRWNEQTAVASFVH